MKSTVPLVWSQNRGRNGWDTIFDVEDDRCVEARNMHLYDGGLGTRRGGSVSVTITGVTGPINALIEYIPGQDQSAAELFVVDGSATTKILRCAAGATFSNLTLTDNVSTEPFTFSAATLNGKLYMAYDSAVNRLHVFDPLSSTTGVRRGGMGTTIVPPVADTGGGAYAATIRYYKARFSEVRSAATVREGEASPAQAFTPSGAGTAVRITKPPTLSEGETHWTIMASADGVTFYDLARQIVALTTYDDSAAVSSYAAGTASPSAGSRTPFPSVKSLGTDGTRLLGFGVWESTAGDSMAPKNGRVYIGPVLDSSSTNDDERINNTTSLQGFIDVARNSGAVDRGISPRPVNGNFFAFQSVGVYQLTPTESPATPYRRVVLSSQIGNLNQASIVMAEDRLGRACCYFLDPVKGPYTVGGPDGLRWCGKDVADLWAAVNRDATVTAWGMWNPNQSQVFFFIAIGGPTPNVVLVLDPTKQTVDEEGDLRGGWTTYDGDFCQARAGTMFSNSLAASRPRTRVPYTGYSGGTKLLRYDETVHQDDTTAFNAVITSGAKVLEARAVEVRKAYLVASAQSAVTIRQTIIRNTGDETNRTSDVVLTPVGSETTVLRKFEDAALQDAWTFQIALGDIATPNVAWQLHQWRATVAAGAEL